MSVSALSALSSYALWFVTPVLGALRNYAKYRTFNPVLFVRTPVLSGLLYVAVVHAEVLPDSTAILVAAISERWVLLAYKMSLSFYYDDFRVKKAKYILKGHIQG
jgi:hypothetical protein